MYKLSVKKERVRRRVVREREPTTKLGETKTRDTERGGEELVKSSMIVRLLYLFGGMWTPILTITVTRAEAGLAGFSCDD